MLSHHRFKIQSTHTAIACLLGLALLSLWPSLGSGTPALPALPQATIDTTYSLPTGGITWTVNAGGDFQAAINKANLGDIIVLQAGATFIGNFTLPAKTTGSGWIYIVSSNYSSLPSPGNRVALTDKPNMPTIISPYGSAGIGIQTATGAHHYRFVGIEIKPQTGIFMYALIGIGNGETSLSNLPHDITVDRCYLHGDTTVGTVRGVAMNGANIAVIDSYISDIAASADAQAVGSWNGPGAFKIVNNFLVGAGENVMFGGSDPTITNLVPSDITIQNNYFYKPLEWMNRTPTWTVKNLLEFKNAQRVLVEGNLFQNNWLGAQAGFSILFTPRNQSGTAPWSTVQDITFQYNTLLNLGSGLNFLGYDGNHPSQNLTRVLIQNNVIQTTRLGGASGAIIQTLAGVTNLTINHNTAFGTGQLALAGSPPASDNVAITNNIFVPAYGIFGTGTAEGNASLATYYTNLSFVGNALVGLISTRYPSGNYFPANTAAVGFVDYAGGNYALAPTSPYKNAGTDGLDLGANMTTLGQVSTGVAGAGSLAPPASLQVTQ